MTRAYREALQNAKDCRAYYKRNAERIKAQKRAYYVANRERICERVGKYRAETKTAVSA